GSADAFRSESFAGARSNGQGDRGRRNHLVLLLDVAGQTVVAGLAARVVGAVTALDLARARLIRIAGFRCRRHRAVVPVPLHGRTVEVGVVVGAALDVDRDVHAQ